MGWGIDDPREVETWSAGIRLVDEWYFSQDPGLDRLNRGYRIAYSLAGLFKVVEPRSPDCYLSSWDDPVGVRVKGEKD